MFNPKRILVPMDFSDEAKLSWDWALMLAGQTKGAALYPTYVFSVLPDLAAVDVGRSDFRKVTQEWVDSNMESLQKKLPKDMPCLPMTATGKPADEIVQICLRKELPNSSVKYGFRPGVRSNRRYRLGQDPPPVVRKESISW